MVTLGNYIIPAAILLIVCAGLVKKENVFDLFISGAKEGVAIAFGILPALIALMTAIAMFRACGAFELIAQALGPLCRSLHIPVEVLPLALMRPVSGSGSLSLFETILKTNGPDSFPGRVASVLQGSTETTFYTVAVYYGSVGISKTRHTLPAALTADFTGFLMSVLTVRLLLY